MKKYLCLICVGVMSLGVAMAQSAGGNTLTLTLDDAISLALSDNPTVKVSNLATTMCVSRRCRRSTHRWMHHCSTPWHCVVRR